MADTQHDLDWSGALDWEKQPLTRELARNLRAATRRHPAIDGHTFRYGDLKEMWAAAGVHVVLTHGTDHVWQYWHQSPTGGWQPVSLHDTQAQARQAAEGIVEPQQQGGVYVLARFPGGNWIRTRVQSSSGVSTLTAIYTSLGCEVREEHVGVG